MNRSNNNHINSTHNSSLSNVLQKGREDRRRRAKLGSTHNKKTKTKISIKHIFFVLFLISFGLLFVSHKTLSSQVDISSSTSERPPNNNIVNEFQLDDKSASQKKKETQSTQQQGPILNNVESSPIITIKETTGTKSTTTSVLSSDIKATIAYAVSITSCEGSNGKIIGRSNSDRVFMMDAAQILKHSIHESSIHSSSRNNNNNNQSSSSSRYSYKMYAFIHPDAKSCQSDFSAMGYETLIKETPIDASQIQGVFLREHVVKSGCCGDKEFLKLYSYTLTQYPVVVHLDLDSVVLQPLDELFDVMIDDPFSIGSSNKKIVTMYDKPLPKTTPINFMFTRDYNMVRPGHKHPGVQGGFLVIRPSLESFEELRQIIFEGNFKQGNGWGGKGYGGYYGAQQIQGLLSYYYDYIKEGKDSVELNRCVYNQMGDSPRSESDGSKNANKCRDGRDFCEDCRSRNIQDIKTIHYTVCQKPWNCISYKNDNGPTGKQCRKFHTEYHKIRAHYEEQQQMMMMMSAGGGSTEPQQKKKNGLKKLFSRGDGKGGGGEVQKGDYYPEIFYGHCKSSGSKGYIPLLSS